MTTDRELLELAAKAAFPAHRLNSRGGFRCPIIYSLSRSKAYMNDLGFQQVDSYESFDWNPLTDDGDALRLAVKLKMQVSLFNDSVGVMTTTGVTVQIPLNNDPYAATRRAIVRAAAEIGKEMK